jgi:hypothetical protein
VFNVTAQAVTGDPDVISKAEFARRRKVSPGRVSQWISEKKLQGEALVGEGREQRIRETVACQQLRRSLDVSQSLGNGLSTNLQPAASHRQAPGGQVLPFERPADQAAALAPAPSAQEAIEDRIKRERAW